MQKRVVHIQFKNDQPDTFSIYSTKKVAEQLRCNNPIPYIETYHNGYWRYERANLIFEKS